MRKLIPLLFVAILCTGCGDTMSDIKEAAAGINSKANEAASAISIDVHSIRATELTFNSEQLTINDLFKAILRDVQWHYDDATEQLTITGTLKDNGLFSKQLFSVQQLKDLIENGKITIVLAFSDGALLPDRTQASMKLHTDVLVDEQGEQLLQHFYEVYKK